MKKTVMSIIADSSLVESSSAQSTLGTSIFSSAFAEELSHSVDKVTYRLALNELFFLNGKDDKNWELACSPGDWLDTELDFGVSNELENNSPEFRLLVDTENIYQVISPQDILTRVRS